MNEEKLSQNYVDTMNKYERMYRKYEGQRVTRSKAIRLKCLDCCAYQPKEVKFCHIESCPLWRYRMGKEEN